MTSVFGVSMRRSDDDMASHLDCQDVAIRGSGIRGPGFGIRGSGLGVRCSGFGRRRVRVQSGRQHLFPGGAPMSRLTIVTLSIGLLLTAEVVSGQRVKQLGHAIVEFRSPDVKAVAAYEYSRRNHSGEWLLVEFAVQAQKRIAIERPQIHL